MKRQFCSLALAAMFGIGAAIAAPVAQDQPAPAPNGHQEGRRAPDPDRQAKTMAKRLNLSSDQESQVKSILIDRQQKMQGIFADNSLSQQDRHEKMRAAREESNQKIRALLNDNQKQAFDQMQQEMRERQQNRREQGQSTQPQN